jgi:hypothetical protein
LHLERAIKHGIMQRTGIRLYGLEVDATGGHVVVRGRAASFHLKQLAIEGVLDVMDWWDPAHRLEIEVQITVMPADRMRWFYEASDAEQGRQG